jgi:hypothetical protein
MELLLWPCSGCIPDGPVAERRDAGLSVLLAIISYCEIFGGNGVGVAPAVAAIRCGSQDLLAAVPAP